MIMVATQVYRDDRLLHHVQGYDRHTIQAKDQDRAIEKARRMAERIEAELELVVPENPSLITWQERGGGGRGGGD
jgi:hypothetical protein